jgi:predicted short-subunit dehydrogenase-like oxidoreductase (DUF2520 family)
MPSPRHSPIIAIVGAGRVGRALGRLLRQRGWRIGAVVTRSTTTARAAARAIGAGAPLARLDASVLAADVVLVTVPDRAISAVANQLAHIAVAQRARDVPRRGALRLSLARTTILHTCGALDRSVLRPLERRGAATGSLHPLQTFGKGFERKSSYEPKSPVRGASAVNKSRGAFAVRAAVPKLKGVACAIEGSPAALRMAQRICRDLGCVPIRVPRGAKPAYHAAAVFAAGHILGVIEAATRILMASGFSRRQAVHALLPLTRQTLANFERNGAAKSWTGPAARGDLATIQKHFAALRRFPREYRAAYAALTRLSVRLLARG